MYIILTRFNVRTKNISYSRNWQGNRLMLFNFFFGVFPGASPSFSRRESASLDVDEISLSSEVSDVVSICGCYCCFCALGTEKLLYSL